MGEIQNRPFQLSFNASLKVGFQGSRVTSEGGLILVRELDERLGFGELIEQYLPDSRGKGTNARKIASGGKRGYIGSQPKGKTEIPDILPACAL